MSGEQVLNDVHPSRAGAGTRESPAAYANRTPVVDRAAETGFLRTADR
jgi:hypothetical protein